jgi:Holliday junction DNA helicase RuvA
VREDALDLYGFRDEQSLSLFEKLLGISGIGPRAALAVLSVAPAEALQNAIATSNLAYLTKVSGIGKKTAEKIILELKDKLVSFETSVGQTSDSDTDALLALESLGYSSAQAREALQNVSKETLGTREKIKEALQNMSK